MHSFYKIMYVCKFASLEFRICTSHLDLQYGRPKQLLFIADTHSRFLSIVCLKYSLKIS